MAHFDSEVLFIESVDTLKGKVSNTEAIIAALQTTALKSAGNQDIDEYTLDDGQTKIRTSFRNIGQIIQAIKDFEQLKQMYLNTLNGRLVRLVDSKSVIHRHDHH